MNKRYLTLYLSLISSCNQKNNDNNKPKNELVQKTVGYVNVGMKKDLADSLIIQKENVSAPNEKDNAEEWLKNIFKTKKSDQYFPEYNVEEKLCTKRFREFISESGEINHPKSCILTFQKKENR